VVGITTGLFSPKPPPRHFLNVGLVLTPPPPPPPLMSRPDFQRYTHPRQSPQNREGRPTTRRHTHFSLQCTTTPSEKKVPSRPTPDPPETDFPFHTPPPHPTPPPRSTTPLSTRWAFRSDPTPQKPPRDDIPKHHHTRPLFFPPLLQTKSPPPQPIHHHNPTPTPPTPTTRRFNTHRQKFRERYNSRHFVKKASDTHSVPDFFSPSQISHLPPPRCPFCFLPPMFHNRRSNLPRLIVLKKRPPGVPIYSKFFPLYIFPSRNRTKLRDPHPIHFLELMRQSSSVR